MRNVIFRFLKTYISMLIIPILLSFVIYFVAYGIIEQITRNASVLALNQAKSIYEQRFNEISHMTYQLYTNSYARSLSNLAGTNNQKIYSRIIETQNNLPKYNVTNSFILDYYILFQNSQKVLNDQIAYNARDFYQSFLHYTSISYDKWFSDVAADASRGTCWKSQPVVLDIRYYENLSKSNINVVTCLLNTGREFHSSMSVIILIDASEMKKILTSVIDSSEDYACIVSKDGLLFDINPNNTYFAYVQKKLSAPNRPMSRTYTDQIGGEKVFVTCTYSEQLGWDLVSIRPYKTVMSNLLMVQQVMIFAACLSVLIGIGLAVFYSLRKNAPAMSLFHDNERFHAQIEEQKPIIQSTFMERLFNGMIDSRQIQMFSRYLDIPLENCYTCFVFQFYDDEQMNLDYFEKIKIIVKETVDRIQGLYFHDVGPYKIAFMMKCDAGDDYLSAANQIIDAIIKDIRPEIPCKIAVAVGKLCTDIQKISLSLNSAIEALNYRNPEDSCQILIADTVNAANDHTLRNDEIILMLNQLEYSMKGGNGKEVETIFHSIESYLTCPNHIITQNAANMIYFSILNLITSLLDDRFESYERTKGSVDDLSRNLSKRSVLYNIRCMKKTCMEVCRSVAAVNTGKINEIITDILAFLHENYSNPDLSLGMLSEKYAISETYISQLFKKYTDENISVYIENLRMSKARELLPNTKFSIHDIASKIGYNSTNTFNKAFKKKYGMPPSACRDIH